MLEPCMLTLQSAVIDLTAAGCGLRWEESACLRYLADLDEFLKSFSDTRKHLNGVVCSHDTYKKKQEPLLISYAAWREYLAYPRSSLPSSLLLSEADMTTLWILFLSVAIAEGFARLDTSKHPTTSLQHPSAFQFAAPFSSYQLDFRHFGIFFFLQTRKPAGVLRPQAYQRLQRAVNEAGYQSPKALLTRSSATAASLSASPSSAGKSASPRGSSSPRTVVTKMGAAAAPAATSNYFLSPRGAQQHVAGPPLGASARGRAHHCASCLPRLQSPHPSALLDDLLDFLSSKINILLRIVHRQYLSDVNHIIPAHLDALSVVMSPVCGALSPTAKAHSITEMLTASVTCEYSSVDVWSPTLVQSFRQLSQRKSDGRSFDGSTERRSSDEDTLRDKEQGAKRNKSRAFQRDTSASSLVSNRNKLRDGSSWTMIIEDRQRETLFFHDDSASNPSYCTKNTTTSPLGRQEAAKRTSETSPPVRSYPSVLLANLKECQIYLLERVKHVKIQGCCDSRIVLPGVSGVVSVTGCSNLEIMAAARSVKIKNSYDVQLNVYTLTYPLLMGDTRGILLGPYNVLFSKQQAFLEDLQLAQPSSAGQWANPLVLSTGASSISRYTTQSTSYPGGGGGTAYSMTKRSASAVALVTPTPEESHSDAQVVTMPHQFANCVYEGDYSVGSRSQRSHFLKGSNNTSHFSSSFESLNGCPHINSLMGMKSTDILTPSSAEDNPIVSLFSFVAPEAFHVFVVPEPADAKLECCVSTKAQLMTPSKSRLLLPETYARAFATHQQQVKTQLAVLQNIKQSLAVDPEADGKKALFFHIIHQHFGDWLRRRGNFRELMFLAEKTELKCREKRGEKNGESSCNPAAPRRPRDAQTPPE